MRWEGRGHIVTMVEAALKSWDPSKRFGKHRKVLSRKALGLDLCLRKNTRVERQAGKPGSQHVCPGSSEGSGQVGRRWTPEILRETAGKQWLMMQGGGLEPAEHCGNGQERPMCQVIRQAGD